MLIDPNSIKTILSGFPIRGILHIGAHECEEMSFYVEELKVNPLDIYWVEAIPLKVEQARQRQIPNVLQAVITNQDDEQVVFHVSNNIQSSSVLELGTHLQEHPHVFYVEDFSCQSSTIDSFLKKNQIDPTKLNFWNLDIQGCELLALQGGQESLRHVDVLYLEVNQKELYRKCALINDLDEFLEKFHFQRVLTKMTEHGWGDAIYLKQKSSSS